MALKLKGPMSSPTSPRLRRRGDSGGGVGCLHRRRHIILRCFRLADVRLAYVDRDWTSFDDFHYVDVGAFRFHLDVLLSLSDLNVMLTYQQKEEE
ncbi:hypothetical protein SESBI_25806 [Sesbania bispinosa]|nr:hypothetical protein SESBI_25806 [Sesbania bispinosa]